MRNLRATAKAILKRAFDHAEMRLDQIADWFEETPLRQEPDGDRVPSQAPPPFVEIYQHHDRSRPLRSTSALPGPRSPTMTPTAVSRGSSKSAGKFARSVPSVFDVPLAGQGDRLVGDDAVFKQCDRDPQGVVIGLKKEMHRLGKKHFGPGRSSVARVELASDMFRLIRRVCRDEVFHADVTRCTLTVPVAFEEQKRECIRRAAELGGFRTVKLVEEPVAAAKPGCFSPAKSSAIT